MCVLGWPDLSVAMATRHRMQHGKLPSNAPAGKEDPLVLLSFLLAQFSKLPNLLARRLQLSKI